MNPWRRYQFQSFGNGSSIERPELLVGCRYISIGHHVSIWHSARIEAVKCVDCEVSITVGDGTVIQPYCHIAAAASISIGENCMFASGVYITDHDHDYLDPSSPAILNKRLIASPTAIGSHTWLGERVMVLKGVEIGSYSVVGAGSVVTKDIPDFSVAVGAPARPVKQWDPKTGCWEKV